MTSYSVDLSSGITETFFTRLEQLGGQKLITRKRLTEITFELLQNIRKHSVSLNEAMLTVQKEESGYSILAINTVSAKDVLSLSQKIEHINQLDSKQLLNQHTKILRKTVLSNSSGAGLGLYRIAIRSASTLKASFTQTNQQHFKFSLHVTLTA